MKLSFFPFSLLLVLFLTYSTPYAQDKDNLLQWFDTQVGLENSRLLNGTAYVDRHRTINSKNKLFGNSTGSGSVLYDGQWFPGLQMRYNIFDDMLIVQLDTQKGMKIVQLVREKVERFTLNDSKFINILNEDSQARVKGIHEILLEQPPFLLLKKHALGILEKRDKQVSYFEFEPIEGYYALGYNNKIYPVESRSDLEKIFPQYKDEIQSYYRTNQSLRRSRPDNFYINLFRELIRLEEIRNLSSQ